MAQRSGFRRGRRGARRLAALAGVALVALAWVAGLFVFVDTIPAGERALPPGRTDAVVVLTGGSLRLETGLALLSAGAADKLFVSGVHRGVDVRELLRLSRATPEALDCCIALGYTADDTLGNAVETERWMAENGYRSLRLVTASYHMPRSLLEFRFAMPETEILAHPVYPDQVKIARWWRWPGTARLVVSEYNKYLVALVRNWLTELSGWSERP